MFKICGQLVEYRENPLGMDEPRPRFFYRLTGDSKYQTARRLRVRRDCGEVVWDSGFVESGESVHIVYDGMDLLPRTRYYWQVAVRDEQGRESEWSDEAFFETGLMGEPWDAKWICCRFSAVNMQPVQRMVRDFTLRERPVRARLYITAVGVYEAFINGKPVTEDCLTPGWTQYDKRIQYQVYDATDLLCAGDNALAAMLGDGWACGLISRNWHGGKPTYADSPLLRAELELDFADGGRERILSDRSFAAYYVEGAIRMSDIYMGETYDAMLDDREWKLPAAPGVRRRYTSPAREGEYDTEIVWQSGAPIRRMGELTPKTIVRRAPGTYIVDFGQNLTGRERIRVSGAPAGTAIVIKHGEMLNPDGSLYRENLRTAAATTLYICGGKSEEVYEPHFTFYGFRYLEISGWIGELAGDMVSAQVIYSELPQAGDFHCSNELVNQLYSNIVWGQKGNFLDVPTDCPQRDERQGWTGDTQVFANAATYNMFAPAFYTKWIDDLNLSLQRASGCYPHFAPNLFSAAGDGDWHNQPATGWGDAGIVCPWVMYRKYGDLKPFTGHLENILHHLDWQIENAGGSPIVANAVFGDWLNLDDPTGEKFLSTAYLAGMNKLCARMARLAGMDELAEEREKKYQWIKEAFGKEFFTAAGELTEKSQTSALLALHFELCPEGLDRPLAERLEQDIKSRGTHLSTGFLGTPLLLEVLAKIGKADLAYELLQQTSYPGWLYPVTQGATTMWERWNSWTRETGFGDVGMNSFNHYAYGAVGEWFFETICGILPNDSDLSKRAFKEFRLAPRPGKSLGCASAFYDSLYGRIVSEWERGEGGTVVWRFQVPCNTRAQIVFPPDAVEPVAELAATTGISRESDGRIYAEPGCYRFSFTSEV